VNLEVAPGEKILLTGASGSGKSTLLRLAAGLLQRHGLGDVSGEVSVGGRDPALLAPAERASFVAFVSQIPTDQLVTGTIADELAFGLESAQWPVDRIDPRIEELWALLGLGVEMDRSPGSLSGGQSQRLVVAASMAARASLLLLDEPLAQLDGEGVASLLALLTEVSASGVAVVMAEHRLKACLPWADRVAELDRGRLAHVCPPGDVALPEPVPKRKGVETPGAVMAEVRDLHFAYGEVAVLRGIDLQVRAGETVALVGPNGVGKSTLLAAFAGDIPGASVQGRVVDVPQDPDLALFCATVAEELAFGPEEWGVSPDEISETVQRVSVSLGIEALLDRPPQALSRGQRLRVAVGAALTTEPTLLILDEPTSGQDLASMNGIMDALAELPPGTSVLFATHDLALARARAHRIVFLVDGVISRIDTPGEL